MIPTQCRVVVLSAGKRVIRYHPRNPDRVGRPLASPGFWVCCGRQVGGEEDRVISPNALYPKHALGSEAQRLGFENMHVLMLLQGNGTWPRSGYSPRLLDIIVRKWWVPWSIARVIVRRKSRYKLQRKSNCMNAYVEGKPALGYISRWY